MKFLVAITFLTLLLINSEAKKYSKCEFARTMYSAGFSKASLPNWYCLVKAESDSNSGIRGPKNSNGSYDYGIFQINDKYWCKVGYNGGDCNKNCNSKYINKLTFLSKFESKHDNHYDKHKLLNKNSNTFLNTSNNLNDLKIK